jgi:hypothetical protein
MVGDDEEPGVFADVLMKPSAAVEVADAALALLEASAVSVVPLTLGAEVALALVRVWMVLGFGPMLEPICEVPAEDVFTGTATIVVEVCWELVATINGGVVDVEEANVKLRLKALDVWEGPKMEGADGKFVDFVVDCEATAGV